MSEPIHLICPSCQAKNRFPAERIAKHPNCGSCKAPLFPEKPFDLTEAALNKHLRNDGIPLLVDFWAAWCGPCRMMAPMFAEASQILKPHLRFAKVNTEEFPAMGSRFAIRGIPLMILFKNGSEIARQTGAMDAKSIVGWVQQNLGNK